MLTKGMLMVVTGISGLVITVIATIVFLVIMRKREFINPDSVSIMNDGSIKYNEPDSSQTDIIATESIYNNGNGTEALESEQAPSGTENLDSQGTEVLISRTTGISK